MSDYDIRKLEKMIKKAGYENIEELKVPHGKGAGSRDLFIDEYGNIVVKPKNGQGPGEPTGFTVDDL